jgi:hypothetical protein
MEREGIMKGYWKLGCTVLLITAFILLSGFRAQTIIHDDGSETQDVLKVSSTTAGQKKLRADADEFQKRNYTIMDYSNNNGEGFRAMRTITKEGANKSSVDHIVHKTHDGLICSTYYIDYQYNSDSVQSLRMGIPMEENNADLEYIVSFSSGTQVVSNSTKSDNQGSTYLWSLKNSQPQVIKLQATVWHKLAIYVAFMLVIVIVVIVLLIEHRRRNVISWKRAAQMRRMEMMLLFIPIFILGYMGYEYFVGTHVTADTLAKVSQQQQEELLENREEDRRLHDAELRKNDSKIIHIKDKMLEISASLRDLNRGYQSGQYSKTAAKAEAQKLASQAKELLDNSGDLSQADKDVLRQVVNRVIQEAEDIGTGQTVIQTPIQKRSVSEEQKRADALSSSSALNDTAGNSTSSDSAGTSDSISGNSDNSGQPASAAGNSGSGSSSKASAGSGKTTKGSK